MQSGLRVALNEGPDSQNQEDPSWWAKNRRWFLPVAIVSAVLVFILIGACVVYFLWQNTGLLLGCGEDPKTLAHWMDHSCDQRQSVCHDAWPSALQCCNNMDFQNKCWAEPAKSKDVCTQDTGVVALNQSYETACAEYDNIRIAFKRRSVASAVSNEIRVTARHPRYTNGTDMNRQAARFCDCTSAGPPALKQGRRLGSLLANVSGAVLPPAQSSLKCTGEDHRKIYDDGNVVIMAWCSGDWSYGHMQLGSVTPNGTKTIDYVATNIVISAKIPDPTDVSYAGVFVLYQNGYVRLLPMVPEGMSVFDTIPYGTSVTIGPSKDALPGEPLPVAQLTRVDIAQIFSEFVKLNLYFQYGNDEKPIVLDLDPSRERTTMTLYGVSWSNPDLAYLRLSGMYVKRGISDGDVIKDGSGTLHSLISPSEDQAWSNLTGPTWSLERECVSIHNTRSPDIYVELVCDGEQTLTV